jgi:hypothetical protein
MTISKYVDFALVEKQSKKTGNTYYAIVLRIKDKEYVLQFLNKDAYDNLMSSLSD